MKKNTYNPNIHHRKSIRLKGYDYAQPGRYFITICCQDRICRFGHVMNGEMLLNAFGKIAFDVWSKLPERFPNIELGAFQIMPNHMHGIISLNAPPTAGAGFTPAQNDRQQNDDMPAQNITHQNNITPAQNNERQNDDPAQNNEHQNNSPQNITHQNNNTPAQNDERQNDDIRATVRVAPTVSNIVGAYKSLVANGCLKIYTSKNETMGKLWQRNYYEHIIRDEKSYLNISNYIINNPAKWGNDKFYMKRISPKKN